MRDDGEICGNGGKYDLIDMDKTTEGGGKKIFISGQSSIVIA